MMYVSLLGRAMDDRMPELGEHIVPSMAQHGRDAMLPHAVGAEKGYLGTDAPSD